MSYEPIPRPPFPWVTTALVASTIMMFTAPSMCWIPLMILFAFHEKARQQALTPFGLRDGPTGRKWAWHEVAPLEEMERLITRGRIT